MDIVYFYSGPCEEPKIVRANASRLDPNDPPDGGAERARNIDNLDEVEDMFYPPDDEFDLWQAAYKE